MSIEKGDKVKLLNEVGEGVVLDVRGKTVIVDIDGFAYEYPVSEVIKVEEDNRVVFHPDEEELKRLTGDFQHGGGEKKRPKPKFEEVFRRVNSRGVPEIDLHIHELIDNTANMTNGEMLEIQLHALEDFIRKCMASHTNEFVVIHGVGEGVLRSEVHKLLRTYGNMEFDHGWKPEYGYGATIVKIKGLYT